MGTHGIKPQIAETLVAELAVNYGQRLRRFLLRRIAKTTDVPDIIQEVYLRMLRIPDVESIRSPEAYLFTVARHVLQQYTLKSSKVPHSVELSESFSISTSETDPALEYAAEECIEQLEKALEQLTPKARATFLLHRREGLSLEEIATRLQISLPMAKKYLMNSLLHLRRALGNPE